MKKRLHYYLLVLPLLILLLGCSDDVYDDYYGRPEGLEDPIFQQLEAKGNFKNLTALITKAGYKDILSKSGYWTMLAPNDDAFAKFFQEQGITDVSKIDDVTASKIVRYALVYNAFRTERMSDYQSSIGWEEDNAFRRRTAFYDGFVTKTIKGESKVIVGSNRNNLNGTNYYVAGDNNNKYVSYFTEEYFANKGLSSADFNYFYPNATYTGFNILDGKVTEADIVAENGIIHATDKVQMPLVNLDQYLEEKTQYSLFRKILEDYLVTYNFNQSATTAYYNYTGKPDNVYVKAYDQGLSFSLNNENYLKQADNDGQSNLYTLIVPEDAAMQKFINEILLKNYASLDKLPKYIFQDLINAHMVQNAVWPSKVSTYNNALNEDIRINFNSDITEAKILSNGFFFGSKKIQESNLFYSVYTSAYLDPRFTLATRLYNDGSGFKEMISNIKTRYTLFLPTDAKLRSFGYDYNLNSSQWTYTNPATGVVVSGGNARSRLIRLLYNGIIQTPNNELNNLSGSGIIRSGEYDLPGEYIKWNNNKVYAVGNEVLGTAVNILGYEDQQNGRTYYIDNLLEFTEEPQGLKIKRLSETAGSQYLSFFNYLKSSTIYDAASGKIQGVDLGVNYTFAIPNNASIAKAVADGNLPSNPNTTVQGEKDLIADFLRYHIISTRTASNDGLTTGQVETLRKDGLGEKTYITILSTPGTLTFRDMKLNSANIITAQSNHLADRSLIHLVDNYLLYSEK